MIASVLLLLAAGGQANDIPSATQIQHAITAFENGRQVQAQAMVDRLLQRKTTRDEQRLIGLLQAKIDLEAGRNATALSGFEDSVEALPDDCTAKEGAGIAALRLGMTALAQVRLEGALGQCPTRWQSWNALAVAADREKDWAVAEIAYRSAREFSRDDPVVLNNAGYSMLLQRRFDEAEVLFRDALAKDPGNVRIANNLDAARSANGKAIESRGKAEGAERLATRLNNAGYAALVAGDATRARSYLEQAMAMRGTFYGRASANLTRVNSEDKSE